MVALTTLFPVFFMLILGFIAKRRQWLMTEQKEDANALIFSVLFPIMIFNLVASAHFKLAMVSVILYAFLVYIVAIFVGKFLGTFTGKERAHFTKYLLTTNEGGSVALPLYLSIVGVSSNTVLFDIAGSAIGFLIIPILVAHETSKGQSAKALAKEVLTHPFVLAILLGLVVNLSGAYQMLMTSAVADLYTGTITSATGPIVGVILFGLGYDLCLDMSTIGPILKLMLVRIVYYSLAILGFFLLFPYLMSDIIFMMAVLIYFMCPTGFAMPSLIQDIFRDDEERAFTSTYISLFIIVTLVVYTLIVVFIA